MRPKLILEIEGDEVTIFGEEADVAKAVDLHLLHYVEMGGVVRTRFRDPVPFRGREIANAAMFSTRRREDAKMLSNDFSAVSAASAVR